MFISSLSSSPSIYRKSTASSGVFCRANAIMSSFCVAEKASTHSLLWVERNSCTLYSVANFCTNSAKWTSNPLWIALSISSMHRMPSEQ